ncbi:hypothetical protein IC744_06835 [Microbacterium hominis]|uniref:hypothetical protein n=1 Tax=Microbacterium hominis TaxID=162426 RepID=UPI00168B0CFB|nr:hypothetical protein [Microbacterium hominis]QOC26063.1 hypothetical protein IC745_01155 [Microbacterium hominis]QOC30034.1 hypothetical protein IC744_06835 [Microbacterium hominis]
MSDQETREALFELWMRFGTCIESDSSEGWEMVDAILSRFAVTPKDETEWEYAQGFIEDDVDGLWWVGKSFHGDPTRHLDEGYELIRRRLGPWEPVPEEATHHG